MSSAFLIVPPLEGGKGGVDLCTATVHGPHRVQSSCTRVAPSITFLKIVLKLQTKIAVFIIYADLLSAARKRAKVAKPKLTMRRDALKAQITLLKKELSQSHDERKVQELASLDEDLVKLERRLFEGKRQAVMAHDFLEGETISRYWMKVNAPNRPDEVIYELEQTNCENGETTYINRSDKMAELAKTYFDSLQTEELTTADLEVETEEATVEALQATNARLDEEDIYSLEQDGER